MYDFRGGECKHIHAIKFWLALKEKLTIQKQEDDLIKQATIEFNEGYDAPVCIYCGSDTITRHGTRKTKIGNKTRMLCGPIVILI